MSLSEPYLLSKLPRVSGVTQRAVTIRDFDSEELHVGISGASISSYILRPSPKLVWSHSIPPSFTVTSLESYGDEIYAGIYNKTKKQYLLHIIKKLENDSELIKEIKLSSKVLDIKRTLSNLIVVTEDSVISFAKDHSIHWQANSLYNAIYSRVIEGDIILIVEFNQKKSNLNFKIIDFKGNEISSRIIESTDSLKNLSFTYNEGILYQYFDNTLKLYRIPHFQEFKALDLSRLSIRPTKGKVTLQSPAKDRLVLAQDSDLYLINTNFEIVSSRISEAKSKLEILNLERKSNKVNRNIKQLQAVLLKDTEISAVTFSLDSNSLKDALGKRFNQNDENEENFKVIPSVLNIQDEKIDINVLSKSKNLNEDLLTFFNASKEYFTEDDKAVDSRFLKKIVSYILDNYDEGSIPENAFTYLLTHPLFPTIPDLLSRLKKQPRLLRQAVVTANVSIKELLTELNTTDNDEIFKDVISRLLEFPREKLIFKDLDNFRIVERIINLNFGFELVSLLIDSTGFFTWNDDLINVIQSNLSNKIDAINSGSKLSAVIEQIETRKVTTVEKVPAYSIEKLAI